MVHLRKISIENYGSFEDLKNSSILSHLYLLLLFRESFKGVPSNGLCACT